MPDTYMPDVEVHIAFNAGYTTPAASRTWTDVSAYVELHEGIDIDFGRKDEQSVADANTLSLTLDNSDGRFTAGRAASPYFPNVKIGRPIRVRVTPPGGTTSVRFVGFIDEWPVEWEGTSAYAKAKIRASSRLSRLGLSARLRTVIEQQIVTDAPVAYWTLGDPAGATSASESSGRAAGDMLPTSYAPGSTPIVFGNATGPEFDDLTAAQFAAGNPLGTDGFILTGSIAVPAGPRSIRCWALLTALPPIVTNQLMDLGSLDMRIRVSTAGILRGPVATSAFNMNDGLGHDIVLVRDGVNEILYVDGVQVATAAASSPAATNFIGAGAFTGTLAHVAVYDYALTPTQVAAQAQAASTAFAGERTDQRVVRLLGWAGVPSSEVTTETGAERVTYQKTNGQSVVDALREVESTESGVLFDDRDGSVRFRNRSHRYLGTAAATLNMAAQHVGTDYSPKLDRSTLLNDVEVSNPTTEQKARVTNKASSDEYGISTGSTTSLALTSDLMQQRANWLVASYAEPLSRVPSLTVDVLAHQGLTPSAQTLLGVTVGDVLAVTNAPTQSGTTSPSYFVEGYTEGIGPESYEITFNLSPSHPSLSTLVLDSATRGLLDTGILAL